MQLVIDIGNTNVKTGVFNHNELVETQVFTNITSAVIKKFKIKFPHIGSCIISSVAQKENRIIKWLRKNNIKSLVLNYKTKLPLINLYESKKTLGYDRIAASVGANFLFPENNILVLDAGSALTIDFINNKNEYLGGNISPGIDMRFKALHVFTKKLPLLENKQDVSLTGKNTEEAIINGIINGIVFEVESYIDNYIEQYNDIKIVITGGDCNFFVKKIKNPIFANSNLVLIGLNRILAENEV